MQRTDRRISKVSQYRSVSQLSTMMRRSNKDSFVADGGSKNLLIRQKIR